MPGLMIFIRISLNYKGIPYKVEWVEYPDIEAVCKKIGAKPTSKKSDGTDLYTLPVISDSSTGAVISDSSAIAKYLDETYPDTPILFPPGKVAAIELAEWYIMQNFVATMRSIIVPRAHDILNPRSQEYFRRTREVQFGMKLEEVSPPGPELDEGITQMKEGLDKVASLWDKNGTDKPYFFGEEFTYTDVVLVSYILWAKITAPSIWEKVESGNGGRWVKLLELTKPYQDFKQ